ncbi:MAG: GNAT family N-acetyltransferase [Solirubrobacterales bacterium]|nr:GNAT family N-acetyltransferase [Solirubrobacterales bacterium]
MTDYPIRPIAPDDRERLRAFHQRLSTESQYRRFLSIKPELSCRDARSLVEIDGRDHFALVATDGDAPDAPLVAVARFIRVAEGSEAAEFAIVVGDDYQRQGVAAELMRRLAEAAVDRGVVRLRATMLSTNLPIQRLMMAIADGPVRRRELGSLAEAEVDLAAARHRRAA